MSLVIYSNQVFPLSKKYPRLFAAFFIVLLLITTAVLIVVSIIVYRLAVNLSLSQHGNSNGIGLLFLDR